MAQGPVGAKEGDTESCHHNQGLGQTLPYESLPALPKKTPQKNLCEVHVLPPWSRTSGSDTSTVPELIKPRQQIHEQR